MPTYMVFTDTLIKKLFNHTSLGEMQCNGKSFTTDPGAIANIFNDYFASVFITVDGIIPYFCSRANTHLDRIDFTQEIVAQALKNLINSISTGPEGIPNILLKKCAYSLAIPLTHIFDMSLKTCKLPDEWKTAPITPIYKAQFTNQYLKTPTTERTDRESSEECPRHRTFRPKLLTFAGGGPHPFDQAGVPVGYYPTLPIFLLIIWLSTKDAATFTHRHHIMQTERYIFFVEVAFT